MVVAGHHCPVVRQLERRALVTAKQTRNIGAVQAVVLVAQIAESLHQRFAYLRGQTALGVIPVVAGIALEVELFDRIPGELFEALRVADVIEKALVRLHPGRYRQLVSHVLLQTRQLIGQQVAGLQKRLALLQGQGGMQPAQGITQQIGDRIVRGHRFSPLWWLAAGLCFDAKPRDVFAVQAVQLPDLMIGPVREVRRLRIEAAHGWVDAHQIAEHVSERIARVGFVRCQIWPHFVITLGIRRTPRRGVA